MLNKLFSIEGRTRVFPWLLGLLAILAAVSFWVTVASFQAVQAKEPVVKISPFAHIKISAKSAVVLDMTSGEVIYAKKADAPEPLASLTKVMTALTATELSSSTRPRIVPFASSTWNLEKLIDYTLIVSSNDGASAIASAGNGGKQIFIDKMNALAQKIGLTQSKFLNEHGLDENENNVGAYGSARDMAKLFQYTLTRYPHLLEATKYPELPVQDQAGAVYNAVNTNISINQIPSLLASKTGFTDLAGGNLIIAFDAGLGEPVIIAVLGSTQEGRFEDVLKLVSATEKFIKDK